MERAGAVWVCGCLGVLVCGCVGVLVCGCVGVCVRGGMRDEEAGKMHPGRQAAKDGQWGQARRGRQSSSNRGEGSP